MSTKIFNTRLQLKYDSYANWSAEDKQFKLLAGEIAVVNVPAETDADGIVHEPAILFKVGDNEHTFNGLPWASALAADVYEWAKKETKPDYKANEIAVEDSSAFFEGANVESVLAEIWTEVKSLTGGEEGAGSIASQIAAGINALGSASAADGNYVSGVKVENGKLVLEEKALPDYSNTYAAKELEQTVADHIAAVAGYDTRITAAQNQADKGVTDAAAAKSAADAAQATADAAYVLPEGGIEGDLSDAVKALLAKADSAVQDVSNLATNERVNGIEERVEAIEGVVDTHATKAELEAEAATARAAEKVNADAIAVLNGNDAIDGSVDKKIKDAFNKFATDVTDDNVVNSYKELIDYAAEHGSEFTELVGEVDANTKAIATLNGDSSTAGSVDKKIADAIAGENLAQYETKADASAKLTEAKGYTDTEIGEEITARNEAIATAKQEAIDAAATDATTKANAAETNAKAYTDEEIDKLHTVATSGKIEDLEQEAEYVIFNCGTASTLVSEPITE